MLELDWNLWICIAYIFFTEQSVKCWMDDFYKRIEWKKMKRFLIDSLLQNAVVVNELHNDISSSDADKF